MSRKVIFVTVVVTVVRAVIASASPVVDAVLVALAVLLIATAWISSRMRDRRIGRWHMTRGLRRQEAVRIIIGLLLLVASVAVATRPVAHAAEGPPRRGGVLLAVIGADPPSLDPHQESTFANIELVAPLYSTLLQLDPYNYPKIIGDVATEWKISPDGLTYTFKLRPGVKFHDGSPLTSADVKASYDKIIFPPQGVRSVRKNAYTAVARVEAPDADHGGVQAQVPVGVAPGQPGLAVERDLPEEVPRPGPELLQDARRWARARSSSRATRAGPPSRASAIPTTSSRTARTSTATSSSSARRRPCGRRPSARAAPTSSSGTCPMPRSRRSRSSSATRSPSRKRP